MSQGWAVSLVLVFVELYLIEIWKIRDFISENRYDGWRLL